MKKLVLTCLLAAGTLACGSVAATAAANFNSTADQTLGIGAAVSFENTQFVHKVILESNKQTIQFYKHGFYSVSYSVTGSLATPGVGAWSVGLYHNGNLVNVSGAIASNAGDVLTTGATVMLHANKWDILELKSTTTANILLSGAVAGNDDSSVRNLSANITLVKIEEESIDEDKLPEPLCLPVTGN
ncbi:MAG: hypothetical protein H0T62_08615 [Parachlamydiaceae bacterium]|nr:hypothetical protein [Parachlamydiaceae bacterium]